jgi:hypothetical protein
VPANCFERAMKSFIFRAVPIALATLAAAYSQPLTAITSQTVTACSNAGSTSGISINGQITNGGAGLALSGAGSFLASYNCYIDFNWQGTGSGNFGGSTGTVGANFTLTNGNTGNFTSWALVATINGTPETLASCSQEEEAAAVRRLLRPRGATTNCAAPVSFSNVAVPIPSGLPASWTWSVDLTANAAIYNASTFSVNIPANAPIDFLGPAAAAPTVPTVPAMTPMALVATAILIVGLGLYIGRRSASGQPS